MSELSFPGALSETDELARALAASGLSRPACRSKARLAATSFGAEFGGGVWALIESDVAEDFIASWSDEYCREFSNRVEWSGFFTTPAGPAAFRVERR